MISDFFDAVVSRLSWGEKLRVGVAFSGGPDSWSLLQQTQAWTTLNGGILKALIVDHGWQDQSHAWACHAEKMACNIGVDAHILSLQLPRRTHQVARWARYDALLAACSQHSLDFLFLGHHEDDNLETLWMRMEQKSYDWGLAGMPSISWQQGITLVRPFLFMPKSHIDNDPLCIQDPANKNQRYRRTLARQVIESLSDDQRQRLCQILHYYRQRRMLHTHIIRRAVLVTFHKGNVHVDQSDLERLPLALQLRFWSHSLSAVSGKRQHIKGRSLKRLIGNLQDNPRRYTLGHCLIDCYNRRFVIGPEKQKENVMINGVQDFLYPMPMPVFT